MQQTRTKEVHDLARLGVKDDQLGIVQKIKILPCSQIVFAQEDYQRLGGKADPLSIAQEIKILP